MFDFKHGFATEGAAQTERTARSNASEKWRKECLKVGKKATYTGVFESALGGGVNDFVETGWIEFWEPLCLGPFGPLAQCMEAKTLPNWHPYRMSGVGLPNVNKIVINAQLG